MYYNKNVISYLKSNNILALKLDRTFTGVGKAVSDQIDIIGAGAKRALFYTSCFTEEYQDVCQKQKNEDLRFIGGIYKLVEHGDIIFDMLKIYFEEIFRHKTSSQLGKIKESLMAVNIHIAVSQFTKYGFILAVSAAVAAGMKLSLDMSVLAGRRAGVAIAIAGMYGVVQKAADSANRLRYALPEYYSALYANELEMMFFLIEPLFERSDALLNAWASDDEVSRIITNMIR